MEELFDYSGYTYYRRSFTNAISRYHRRKKVRTGKKELVNAEEVINILLNALKTKREIEK